MLKPPQILNHLDAIIALLEQGTAPEDLALKCGNTRCTHPTPLTEVMMTFDKKPIPLQELMSRYQAEEQWAAYCTACHWLTFYSPGEQPEAIPSRAQTAWPWTPY